MPIQLTFDGSPKLLAPFKPADLDLAIELNSQHCMAEADKLHEPEDAFQLWLRLAFALVSVNSPFDATCEVWKALHTVEPWDRLALRQALSQHGTDGVVMYQPTKMHWLYTLWLDMTANGVTYMPHGLSDLQYRQYLKSSVLGLAWAKSSFAVMVVKGSADVCCIDTHMHRILTGMRPTKQIGGKRYAELEDSVRRLAGKHALPTSVAQHAIWDAARGIRSPLLPEMRAT